MPQHIPIQVLQTVSNGSKEPVENKLCIILCVIPAKITHVISKLLFIDLSY